jgi:hypothetical protein
MVRQAFHLALEPCRIRQLRNQNCLVTNTKGLIVTTPLHMLRVLRDHVGGLTELFDCLHTRLGTICKCREETLKVQKIERLIWYTHNGNALTKSNNSPFDPIFKIVCVWICPQLGHTPYKKNKKKECKLITTRGRAHLVMHRGLICLHILRLSS